MSSLIEMKYWVAYSCLASVAVSACGPSPKAAANQTALAETAISAAWTPAATPAPTVTVTPNPTPTVTVTPTATPTAVPPTCEPATEPAAQEGTIENASVFEIVAAESQARFIIDEVFDRKPNTVIGETNQVSGSLTVDMANPSLSKVGPIRIAAGTLRSDGSLRDYSIHWFILVTRKYETIEFVPISIEGLPERVELGELVTFRICGDLNIRDSTRAETFEVALTALTDTRLDGSASTVINRTNYGLEIPRTPYDVADVSEQVELVIDFVATRGNAENN